MLARRNWQFKTSLASLLRGAVRRKCTVFSEVVFDRASARVDQRLRRGPVPMMEMDNSKNADADTWLPWRTARLPRTKEFLSRYLVC